MPIARRQPDRSARLRGAFQLGFLILNLWLGIQFYLFVRHYETGGKSVFANRPPGVEGWLPVAGLMNLKAWLLTGELPRVHPATLFLLLAILALSLLFRKAFCSWLCPVGTLSEYLWRAGRSIFHRNFAPPRWADLTLRSLKYLLLALFAYAVASMPVENIHAFLESPYGLIADVKMLNFFRYLGIAGAAVLGVLAILSILVRNFWCRYLCPYGALLGLTALLSPLRIRRDRKTCIDCAKCAKACPSALPVDTLVQIRSAECLGCLECVEACPVEGALEMSVKRGRSIPGWAMAAGIALVFLGTVAYARWTGHWHSPIPPALYQELIPHAREFSHP